MRSRPLPAAVLFSALVLPAQAPDPKAAPAAKSDLQNVRHEEAKFHSAAIDADVPYGVYLPKGYDEPANKDTKWPLVVWLHGMWEDHQRFHVRGGAPVLDRAIGEGLLPPCVFVLANGGRTSMYLDAGPKQDYQQLVQKDLLEHVAKTYRISDRRDERALMGISMGGMAALRIGFTHPELFGTIAVHSSAVFPADPKQLPPRLLQRMSDFGLDKLFGNPIDEKRWQAANPLCLAAALDPAKLGGLRIWFDAGTNDRYEFGKTNTLLHQALDARKVLHTWTLVQGGGHAWGSGFQEESLLGSLHFVGDGFRAAAKAAAAGPADAKGGTRGPDHGK